MTRDPPRPDADAIERRIVALVADLTEGHAETIDPDQPMEAHGLTSLMAVELSAALEDWLLIPVDATIAWEHPSASGLARHLAERVAEGGRGPS